MFFQRLIFYKFLLNLFNVKTTKTAKIYAKFRKGKIKIYSVSQWNYTQLLTSVFFIYSFNNGKASFILFFSPIPLTLGFKHIKVNAIGTVVTAEIVLVVGGFVDDVAPAVVNLQGYFVGFGILDYEIIVLAIAIGGYYIGYGKRRIANIIITRSYYDGIC